MSQKYPAIGLRAEFILSAFIPGARKYLNETARIDRATQQTAQRINRATQRMTQDVARSFTDFARKSSIVRDAFDNLRPEAAIQEYQRLSQAFSDLGDNARVNVDVFDQLVNAGVGVADAMRVAGGQVQFNLQAFDSLIQRGIGVEEAFRQASGGAEALSGKISILGREFSVMAVSTSAAIAALRLGVRIIRESNEEYDEFAEATRRVRLQTGLLTQEASAWVTVLETSGVSTATAERSLTNFLGKVADLRRDMLEGEELTSDFAKAMGTLGISVVDSQGNLRTTEEILNDVNRAFQRLGPGIVSAQLATDLFGYSGRQLLPIFVDQEQSLADLTDEVERYGASLGAIDRQQFEDLRNSQTRLRESTRGLRLEIGRGWVEARTEFNNFLAEFLNGFRKLDAAVRAGASIWESLQQGQTEVFTNGQFLIEQYQKFLTGESETARAAEESAQARANAAQDLAAKVGASESEIREEREKTLKQLDEIKTRLIQKLDEIDRDAERKWADILVNRQRDAFDRSLQVTFRLIDIQAAYRERLDAIEADFAKRWEDILVNRQRDALLRGIRLAQRYEDLARSAEQRRADAIRDSAERGVRIRREAQRRTEDVERDARRRREELERDHQRRLRDIRQEFLGTALEAARRNDAVTVARAQRQRARELRDEQQRYEDERRDQEDALRQRREDIERDRQQREQDHRQELERELRRIEENYARQREALERQNQREREIREIQYQWEKEDFDAAKAEQLQAAEEWRQRQLDELQKAFDREEILRRIQYERQEIDFNKAWQRRIDDAQEWYERERDELAEHLNLTGRQLELAYEVWIRAAAEAAAATARAAADALASEIVRYQHLLTEMQRTQAGLAPGAAAPVAPQQPLQTRRNEQGVYVPVVPGAPIISQAEGGVVQASGPTNVIMGDAGPEMGVFLPGGGRSMNINHSFGRLGVDFQGLPGGMNTQQVQSIVYAVVTQLAKGIQVPRR
jgi:hypothetical protein